MSVSRIASRFLARTVTASSPIARAATSSSVLQRLKPEATAAQSTRLLSTTRNLGSDGTRDLVSFLSEEIRAEKDNQSPLPSVAGFKVEQDNADLRFVKEHNGEKITVQLNVNHTVDSAEADDGSGEEAPEMKSKPNFEVDIVKGGRTLTFTCSYIHDYETEQREAKQDGYNDVFTIDEVAMYDGEWNDKVYAVAGDIIDGQLYDLLMNMLDARGITHEFSDQLSAYCSAYEHGKYIRLLEDLEKFFK